jgi:uncharacterized membrane protein YbhN (UPF0104 family)
MALAYTSLGIPAGSAAVIAIAYRGLSFWLPLLAGIVFVRRLERVDASNQAGNDGSNTI